MRFCLPHALVISEDESCRHTLIDLIERQGFSSDVGLSVEDAHSRLKQNQSDLLLVDARLSDGTALDLLTQMRAKTPPQVAILCDDPAFESAFDKLGSHLVSCLPKPIDPKRLRRLLSQVARKNGQAKRLHRSKKKESRASNHLMLGNSQPMREVYEMVAKVAPTDATVLICGETGTGKELVAQAIHDRSQRRDKRFEAINCGAIPENLIESELFGHEKGAFTGADKMRRGVFERANGGTLFLDEITEMSADMQVRLLRVLETGNVTRIGSEKEFPVDVRVLAATNRDTAEAVDKGEFREDLLFRIAVFPISLPPLRNRGDDVILIANHYLSALNREHSTHKKLTEVAKNRLKRYHWPGNVRQLRNIVLRSYIVESPDLEMGCLKSLIKPGHHPGECGSTASGKPVGKDPGSDEDQIKIEVGTPIDKAEQQLIFSTLEKCEGDKKQAAELLGISLRTLYNRLNDYEEKDAQQRM